MKKFFLLQILFCIAIFSAKPQPQTWISNSDYSHYVSSGLNAFENHLSKIFNVESSISAFPIDTTRKLVQLVTLGAELVRVKGEVVFKDFRETGSQWRQDDAYIFVLDPEGNMIVHPDPELEGKNTIDLKDVNGKPIIRGLIGAASGMREKNEGWYHYQWPVPGGLLPRWKSSYVQSVKAPSGKSYVIGCGIYNDRMEKEFVVDIVKEAIDEIEKNKESAFRQFHDPTSPFVVKDAYVFVITMDGIELVNPAFRNLEGRNVLDVKDTRGKFLVREMLRVANATGSGWVDYMWPKPGESISTQKSTYVSRAKIGDQWLLVGCGAYLNDAPKAIVRTKKMAAPELMKLVRDAAKLFELKGEKAFPEFRKKGSKWFRGETYFFVYALDGVRYLHAADRSLEGLNVTDVKDVLGRPYGKMMLDVANTDKGEGWVHYMFPLPGDIFPAWKSTFTKRVTFPSGQQYVIGSGIYNMQMDKAFIEDVVDKAAALVKEEGPNSFDILRSKTGPFVFMDVYVFVDNAQGIELVNSAQPSVEGKNIAQLRDAYGKLSAFDYINKALEKGKAWVDYYWYKPGDNKPARKQTYVRKVEFGKEIYIVGAGFYLDEEITGALETF